MPGRSDRTSRTRAAQRLVVATPLEQANEERGAERVARRRAIDRDDRRRHGPRDLSTIAEKPRTRCAAGDRDEPRVDEADDRRVLLLVHDDQVSPRDHVSANGSRRRRVEREPAGCLAGGLGNDRIGDLELTEHSIAIARRDVARFEPIVRTGDDDDRRLCRLVDDDQGEPGRPGNDTHGARVHPLSAEASEQHLAITVIADRADEGRDGAKAGQRDRLVRALTAGNAGEGGRGDRRPRPRKRLNAGDEIDVRRTDDGHARSGHGGSIARVTPVPLDRAAFLTTDTAYFAGNSLGLPPHGSREAVERVLDEWGSHGVEGWFEAGWLEAGTTMAGAMARVVGAEPPDVAVMNTLTVNLHLLLAALYRPTPERYRIVIDADAFPSDSHVVASHVGWHGLDPADAVVRTGAAAIDETVAVVLLAGISYLTGERADIAATTRRAHDAGALAIWDLAHSAGNVPVDLNAAGVDAAAWCTYKYLNGGPGAPGAVFIHRRHHDAPRLAGWWGVDPKTRFAMSPEFVARPGAAGFAMSTPSAFAFASLGAALEVFDRHGIAAVRERSVALTDHLEAIVGAIAGRRPISVITPTDPERRGAQLSLRVAGARAVANRLRVEHAVLCDFREPDVLRFAPSALYTTADECARAGAALDVVLA